VIEIWWVGADGTRWDLRRGPVRLTAQSLAFLYMITTEAFTSQSAYVDGQRLESWTAKPTEFDVQVVPVGAASVLEWVGTDQAWKAGMRPGRYGRFEISHPSGSTRYLSARPVSELPEEAIDPYLNHGTVLTYGMVADDPWWYGADIVETFGATEEPLPFYGPRGYGPPFYLASSATPGAAVITNSGDVEQWPVWTFYGATPRFSARVDGQLIAGEFPIADGDWIRVDTRPYKKSALTSAGINVTRDLTSRRFAPVPSGADVPVEVLTYGDSQSTLTLTPKFFRGY
jgi:hypothetical protein